VGEEEPGDPNRREHHAHPADPQRLARPLLRAQESPAVQAGRRAEPVKTCLGSSGHLQSLWQVSRSTSL